jgi:alpha-L-fucosidase
MKRFFLIILIVQLFISCNNKEETKAPLTKEENIEWWKDARFGMFIHWGLYALPAGEWKGEKVPGISEWIMLRGRIPVADYEALAKDFNPVKYNADEWARLAKQAGMKYIVITSKHHDGFAMFHSSTNPYNIVDATPFDRDPLKELAEACKKYGLKLGFYHSQAQDWNHPGGTYAGIDRGDPHWDSAMVRLPLDTYIEEKVYPQVTEILTNYGDIAIMWWDTPIGMTEEAAEKLHTLLDLQPGIIENNRLYGPWDGDFSTPEQHIPPTGLDYNWEVCMTMNTSWGYKHYDENWKSTKTLVQYLTDIASKGGNFLLNVGPTAEGEIPQPSIERLEEMGDWMKTNGESIYGTTASPFFKLLWGRCTKKESEGNTTLYLHVFEWPENGVLILPGVKNEVSSIVQLHDGSSLNFSKVDSDIHINVENVIPDPYNTVLKMEIVGAPDVVNNMPVQDQNGEVLLPAAFGFIHNRGYGEKAVLSDLTEESYIENWIDGGTHVEYMFEIQEVGTFSVVIEAASETSEVDLNILTGDADFPMVFGGSGDLSKFEEIMVGEIELAEPGVIVITLKAGVAPWNQFKLKSLKLARN